MNVGFSVLISVYARENPAFLDDSLMSVVNQSLLPSEIILVRDGELGQDLNSVLMKYKSMLGSSLKIVSLPENKGLGVALQFGLNHVEHDIVARMDSDDIADNKRFEKQISFLVENPQYDAVGSSILEFKKSPEMPSGYRDVPETQEAIYKTAKWKNPLNHMTVVFRKYKVMEAGGYLHVPFFEDYDLWVRMLSKGMQFYNLKEPLVYSRVGDMIGRRHGLDYCLHEINFFKRINRIGFINNAGLYKILLLRLPLRLFPKKILTLFYNLALRRRKI